MFLFIRSTSGQIVAVFLSSYNKTSFILSAVTVNGSLSNQIKNASVQYCESHPVKSVLNQTFSCADKNSFISLTHLQCINCTVHTVILGNTVFILYEYSNVLVRKNLVSASYSTVALS